MKVSLRRLWCVLERMKDSGVGQLGIKVKSEHTVCPMCGASIAIEGEILHLQWHENMLLRWSLQEKT